MTLRQLAEGIAKDARLLQNTTQMLNQVAEYAELRDDLLALTGTLEATMELAQVMADAAILDQSPVPPAKAVSDIAALAKGGEFVDAPLGKAKTPMKQLEQWATQTSAALKAHYETWFDETVPSLNAAEAFADRLGKVDGKAALRIRVPVAEAKRARLTGPQSVEDIVRVRELAADIRTATTDVAPTQATQDFLLAILGPGVPLDALTDEVRDWAHEKDFWSSLRIRLGDVDD